MCGGPKLPFQLWGGSPRCLTFRQVVAFLFFAVGSCRAGAHWLEAILEQMSKVSALWWVGILGSSHTGAP